MKRPAIPAAACEPDRRIAVDAPNLRLDGVRSVGDGGKVDNRSKAVDERAAIEFGGDIRDEDLIQLGRNRARRDQPPYRGADRVAAREQRAAKGSADEARRAGDENAHMNRRKGAAFP